MATCWNCEKREITDTEPPNKLCEFCKEAVFAPSPTPQPWVLCSNGCGTLINPSQIPLLCDSCCSN